MWSFSSHLPQSFTRIFSLIQEGSVSLPGSGLSCNTETTEQRFIGLYKGFLSLNPKP